MTDKRIVDAQGNPITDASAGPTPGGEINFASFVLSLSTSAMVHLGVMENPMTKSREEDLEIAKQEIRLIEIIKEKTNGNLSSDESRLMEDVLFHLRMVYVEKTKKGTAS